MKPLLEILIPTLVTRRHYRERLMRNFHRQLDLVYDPADGDRIRSNRFPFEIRTLEDNGEKTIGEKRQTLLKQVTAPYFCFFDDDDLPSEDYASEIHKALTEPFEDGRTPDVIGFRLRHFEDGVLTGLTIHSVKTGGWKQAQMPDGMMEYQRTPNHLNPVRTEIGRSIGFPYISSGEDGLYCTRMYLAYKDKWRERFIDKFLYNYFYRSKRPEGVRA